MPSINASPEKAYIILFILLIIGYSIFLIIRTLRKTNPVEVEHFVEEHPDYQYRMEVMKVFDLYMSRNPTPEEIDKYAVLRNEQEILLAFLRDFNINANDVNKDKLAKYAEKEVDAIRDSAHKAAESWVDEETPTVPVVDANVEKFDQDKIVVPVKVYMELKKKIEDFESEVAKYNKDMLEHYM